MKRLILLVTILALFAGCAKPDYAMIQQMHQSTMEGNTAIAQALAGMNNVQAEFIFTEAVTLPAGTTIRTYYDFSHAFKFNDPSHNPAVRVFEAEAARDSAVTQAVVGGLVTGAGIGFGADLLKTAIKNAGSTNLTNAQDGTLTVSGGLGDRTQIGTGGITDSIDMSTPSTISTSTSSVNSDPVVVPQPDPIIIAP